MDQEYTKNCVKHHQTNSDMDPLRGEEKKKAKDFQADIKKLECTCNQTEKKPDIQDF